MYLTSDEQRLARITERAHASSAREVPPDVQAYLSAPPRRARKKNASAMPQIADESGEGFLLDRRGCERVALAGEVTVRRIGGFNFQVELEDVSPAGCRIEMIEEAQAGEAAHASESSNLAREHDQVIRLQALLDIAPEDVLSASYLELTP